MTTRGARTTAAEVLAQLQRQRFAEAEIPLPDPRLRVPFELTKAVAQGSDVDAAKVKAMHDASLEEAIRLRPTPYEDPARYSLMLGLVRDVEKAAGEIGLELPPRPVFGTLPVSQLNAMAIGVPGTDERLVVFQYGVFGFFNLVTKAFAAALAPSAADEEGRLGFSLDPETVTAHLHENPEPLARFFDFLAAYVVAGDPHAAEPYVLRGTAVPIATMLLHATERFVLAHEYGHLIEGHIDQLISGADAAEDDAGSEDGPPSAWILEHEADARGTQLVLASMLSTGHDLAMSYMGIDLVFSAMSVAERAVSLLRDGTDEVPWFDDEHPPALLRRELLRRRLQYMVRDDDEAVTGALELAELAEAVLEMMWSMIRPTFVRMRDDGVRPAPIWSLPDLDQPALNS